MSYQVRISNEIAGKGLMVGVSDLESALSPYLPYHARKDLIERAEKLKAGESAEERSQYTGALALVTKETETRGED
jgi:hypothetical protein